MQSERKHFKHQRGFTIVEAMISLTIGLILLIGMTQAFVGSKKTYRLQENLVRLQENGRFATQYINNALHMAGYYNPDVSTPITIINPISGTEHVTDPDTISVGFEAATNLCSGAPIAAGLESLFTFYIADHDGDGKKSLYCDDDTILNSSDVEIAENIGDIEIVYGEDTTTDGSADRYVDANGWTNINNVKSVRIYLSFHTDDELTHTPQPYVFKGSTVTPANKYIYRTFTTTARLRNHSM